MKRRYALSAIFGLALLPIASAPASANIGGMTQTAIATEAIETDVIQVQRRGGGYRGGARVGVGRVGVARALASARWRRACGRGRRSRPRPLPRPLRLSRRPLGASAQLLVAGGRRDCSRRRARHGRSKLRGMGRPAARTRLLLVLHRPEPAAGLLGSMPVAARNCATTKTPPRGGVFVAMAAVAGAQTN